MPTTIESTLLVGDESDHFAIIVSRFNDLVTRRLLDGALETFRRHGAKDEQLTVVWAPGSFELPQLAQHLATSKKFAAIIALGAVIQGETTHHDYINQQVAAGLMRTAQETGIPVMFGVLTCENLDQALNRAGGKAGNKGTEAALAAIEMVNTLKLLKSAGD
ncbi:MAG TPA: 6,7-dimethyl-8-ribityllumazine synthase [Planctomycetaceae bacterium]|nr:6,7-dimethyl-8-ribityllumazine synthase [Planctomycetaceae bacterium]